MAKLARRIGVIAMLVGILVVGWWQIHQLRSQSDNALGPDGDVGLTVYPGSKGIPAPGVEGQTVEGDYLRLTDLRGHVVVLNVWGSWCAPCRAEAPDLTQISKETAPRGVRFVGIDVRDNPAAARAFARKYDITYPSWDDQNGLVLAQLTGIIPVSAVPSTVVVDKDGLIRARVVGRVEASILRGLIEDTEKAS